MKKKTKRLDAILEKVGAKLRDLRMKKGYDTIKEFASDHQLPPIQYWRIEKGKSNLTVSTLLRLIAIHDLTVEEFFCLLKARNVRS